ncbi:MAG TPA: xanthine dehydrogenase family protein subunit M [Xanthobacteraceae bacterium]|jgi:carbon-monoxide dehydrogenase medium subunit|nr:xanthine dehydrogenase family protein subunit M [Xanthobacteraceae bacterium]
MKPAPFAYHRPNTINDLVALVASCENAKLIAGGQSLVPMLNMRYVIPDHVIDLNRIESLNFIRENNGAIEIGAMTRQCEIEHDQLIARRAPILQDALRHVGHLQTRSRGTIGGSLCHLDPAAELPGIAALYDATLHIAGPRGTREVNIADWSLGYMTPALEPDEVLTHITFPLWKEPHGHAFLEIARRLGDFAIVGVGCLLALDRNGAIARAAISLVGVSTAPVRLSDTEAALIGQKPTESTFKAAAEHARTIECLEDAQISASYRQRLAGVLVARALKLASARAEITK